MKAKPLPQPKMPAGMEVPVADHGAKRGQGGKFAPKDAGDADPQARTVPVAGACNRRPGDMSYCGIVDDVQVVVKDPQAVTDLVQKAIDSGSGAVVGVALHELNLCSLHGGEHIVMEFDVVDPLQAAVLRLFERSMRLFIRKNTDYGSSFSKDVSDIPAYKANWVRCTDKIRRIDRLLEGYEPQVKDETIVDTMFDLSVYPILMVYCYDVWKTRPLAEKRATVDRLRRAYEALRTQLEAEEANE